MDMIIKMLFCLLVAVGGGEKYYALGKYFKLTLKEIWNSGVKIAVTTDSWGAKCNCLLRCEVIAIKVFLF